MFFGCALLGAQPTYHTYDADRAVVDGSHGYNVAATHEQCIELFVLCPNCRLPEPSMCACSAKEIVDMTLCTYILAQNKKAKQDKKKSDKKNQKEKKENGTDDAGGGEKKDKKKKEKG